MPSNIIGKSPTYRELYTVLRLLAVCENSRENSTLQLYFDSLNAKLGINNFGSNTPEVNRLLLHIWLTSASLNISLTASWVSRTQNLLADSLSKVWDRKWQLTDHANTTARSLNRDPRMEILTPKFTKIGPLLVSLKKRTIVIHPVWRSQSWWPLLHNLSRKSISLGSFSNTFLYTTGNEPPAWEFRATLLQPYRGFTTRTGTTNSNRARLT